MKPITTLLLAIAIVATQLPINANAKEITPNGGISMPMGESGIEWTSGFALGLQFPLEKSRHGEWSVVTSYQQISPNGPEMLKIGGRKMKMDASEGFSRILELSVIGDKRLWESESTNLLFGVQYGAGVFLVVDDKVHVKGSYQSGTAALTREIFHEAETVAAPGITLGGQLTIMSNSVVYLKLQHLFTAEPNRDLMFFGIGFRPY